MLEKPRRPASAGVRC